MSQGLDFNQNVSSIAGEIVGAGYDFVARYLKPAEPSETLTLAEARHISAEGLSIVSIVEIGSPTCAAYFTSAKGTAVAEEVVTYADETLGQPSDTPLYYTVDYDAQECDFPAIHAFFAAARAHHQAHAANGGNWYKLGVYGSGAVCEMLVEAGLVEYTWLSESSGFLGSRTYTGWSLHQTREGTFDGVDCDFNESNGNAGGWKLS